MDDWPPSTVTLVDKRGRRQDHGVVVVWSTPEPVVHARSFWTISRTLCGTRLWSVASYRLIPLSHLLKVGRPCLRCFDPEVADGD